MNSFGEVLAFFKSSEDASSIVPLVDDDELRRGIVAWKSVVIRYKQSGTCEHKDEASRWNWLWDNVEFSQDDFGTVAGVRGQDVGKLLARLIGLRLLYPDGTIHNLAKQYLQTLIWSKLRQVQSKEPRRKTEVPPEKTSEKV